MLCALTTAIGFLAFLPTQYRGVSELGVISSGGVLAIVFLTLTLFPVLIRAWLRGAAAERLRARRPMALPFRPPRRPGLVFGVAAGLAVLGAWLAPQTTLEANVVALRNPETESVEAFMDLLDSDRVSPWYADILAPDLAEADALAVRARELPEVARALTISDYVPSEQEEKLEILADAALFMDLPPAGADVEAPPLEEQVDSLRELARFLGARSLDEAPGGLARSGRLLREQLQGLLARIEADDDPEAAIRALETALLGSVPGLLDRLRTSLDTPGVEFESLPPALVERMLADDGTAACRSSRAKT